MVSWILGKLEALYFITYLDSDYFAYLTGLELKGDYLTGDLGPVMLRCSSYKKLGPAFQASSRRSVPCPFDKTYKSLFCVELAQPGCRSSSTRSLSERPRSSIWSAIFTSQPTEFISDAAKVTKNSNSDDLLPTLREAKNHFDLPSECTTVPAKRILKALKKSLRTGRRKKFLSGILITKKPPQSPELSEALEPSVEPRGEGPTVYDEEWYRSHFIFSPTEEHQLTKILNDIRKNKIPLPENMYTEMYREYLNNISHSRDLETKRFLTKASPLTDFSRFCILYKEKIFDQFPKTKKSLVLFWTIATRQWQSLSLTERSRRNFISCKPYQPYADSEELKRFLMYSSEDSDGCDIDSTLVDMSFDLNIKAAKLETGDDSSRQPLVNITNSSGKSKRNHKEISNSKECKNEENDIAKSNVSKEEVKQNINDAKSAENEHIDNSKNTNNDGAGSSCHEGEESTKGTNDDDSERDYKPNFETCTGEDTRIHPDSPKLEVITSGMIYEEEIKDEESSNDNSSSISGNAEKAKSSSHDETSNFSVITPIKTEIVQVTSSSGGDTTLNENLEYVLGESGISCLPKDSAFADVPEFTESSPIQHNTSRSTINGLTFDDSSRDINRTYINLRNNLVDVNKGEDDLRSIITGRSEHDEDDTFGSKIVKSLPLVRLKRFFAPLHHQVQSVDADVKELLLEADKATSVPEKVNKYEKIIGIQPGRNGSMGSYFGWASAGEACEGNGSTLGKHRKQSHPRRQRSLNLAKSLDSATLQKLYREHNEEELYSGRDLLRHHIEKYKRTKEAEFYGNRNRSLRDRLNDLLDDRMMDMANAAEFRHKMIHPRDLYGQFLSSRVKPWNTISSMEKEPYYDAFKRQYYWVIFHPDPEEQGDLMFDVAETCLEFGEPSLPVVARSVFDATEDKYYEDVVL
ncbi:hypothetical protein FOA43_003999 [Brettanomyces nanus]|uniref:Uncharacterized protein n=1 Tax=Eeniella nana TaxID=13502 RepID=A0A875RX01_EENNA|nr:uncharacterized protein FOA43_003999 [Brettanomyces nanus]QPG76607.1 hypothetical protein FOA43_003999 [Brettanomyces nanus]